MSAQSFSAQSVQTIGPREAHLLCSTSNQCAGRCLRHCTYQAQARLSYMAKPRGCFLLLQPCSGEGSGFAAGKEPPIYSSCTPESSKAFSPFSRLRRLSLKRSACAILHHLRPGPCGVRIRRMVDIITLAAMQKPSRINARIILRMCPHLRTGHVALAAHETNDVQHSGEAPTLPKSNQQPLLCKHVLLIETREACKPIIISVHQIRSRLKAAERAR